MHNLYKVYKVITELISSVCYTFLVFSKSNVNCAFCSFIAYHHYFEVQHFSNFTIKYEPIKFHLAPKKTDNSINCLISIDFCHVFRFCMCFIEICYTLDSLTLNSYTVKPGLELGSIGSTQFSLPFS